jgi:UDP-2-acetamido-2-deoxy-ribo-hexuluronate aminotransferase
MDTLQCAVVLAKLDRFDWEIARRIELGQRYSEMITSIGADVQQLAVRPDRTCVWGQFTVMTDRRNELQKQLADKGVPTAVHYPKPLHLQPAYAAFCCPDCCPNSLTASNRVMSLPMSPDLSDADMRRVVEALSDCHL